MLHRDRLVQTGVPSMHHTGTIEHINNLVPPCILSEASPSSSHLQARLLTAGQSTGGVSEVYSM